MKWFMAVLMLLTSSVALSKSEMPDFNELSVIPDNVLEQQRGGFFTAGANFSIGLTMKVMVNNKLVFLSTLNDMINSNFNTKLASVKVPVADNNDVNSDVNSDVNVTGAPVGSIDITPILESSRIGFIIRNNASNVITNASIDIDATVPINFKLHNIYQRNNSRIRAATMRLGY